MRHGTGNLQIPPSFPPGWRDEARCAPYGGDPAKHPAEMAGFGFGQWQGLGANRPVVEVRDSAQIAAWQRLMWRALECPRRTALIAP